MDEFFFLLNETAPLYATLHVQKLAVHLGLSVPKVLS